MPNAAEPRFPTHVAIIVDGNRRWAKQRLMPVSMGHKVLTACARSPATPLATAVSMCCPSMFSPRRISAATQRKSVI